MAYTNIDDPSAHFQAKGYAGNSVDNTAITNDGNSDLQPDLIWFARYDTPADKFLLNSSTGVTKFLISSGTSAEGTSTSLLKSFDTNGFSVGTNSNTNSSSSNYVAWQWKANGGTTSSNTAGNITSTVQVNSTAGFSIVKFTGNENSSATVGHGLGVKPDMVFFKRRNATYNWVVYCGQLGIVGGNNMFAYLNLTNAAEQGAGFNFTSTTITPTNGAPTNSGLMLAYCFAEKQGYSKFGKYVGNGNLNGPFVYTGFKPAFVMIKRTDSSANWDMFTGEISTFNIVSDRLRANLADAEQTGIDRLDFVSNGFKIRNTNTTGNISGGTYIYMAFADNPLVTSTGIPTTAR